MNRTGQNLVSGHLSIRCGPMRIDQPCKSCRVLAQCAKYSIPSTTLSMRSTANSLIGRSHRFQILTVQCEFVECAVYTKQCIFMNCANSTTLLSFTSPCELIHSARYYKVHVWIHRLSEVLHICQPCEKLHSP